MILAESNEGLFQTPVEPFYEAICFWVIGGRSVVLDSPDCQKLGPYGAGKLGSPIRSDRSGDTE